jgi:hypothetical protein
MDYDVEEKQHKVLISKWGSRKRPKDAYGYRQELKQIVIKHVLGFKTKKGKTAYRSETRHVPI